MLGTPKTPLGSHCANIGQRVCIWFSVANSLRPNVSFRVSSALAPLTPFRVCAGRFFCWYRNAGTTATTKATRSSAPNSVEVRAPFSLGFGVFPS